MKTIHRRAFLAPLTLTLLVLAVAPARAQNDALELLLELDVTRSLVNEALADATVPLGGLLGRISPSSSFGTDEHGFGYFALSGGLTAIQFEITSPDYTEYRANGNQATMITAPSGAIFADAELGVYSGYDLGRNLQNVGTIDLLFRYGLTIGDQPSLTEDVSASDILDGLEPIYGAGLRIGLLRGPDVPALSFSFGFNQFVERVFGFQGEDDEFATDVTLTFEQVSSFYLFEASKQFAFLAAYGGAGAVNHKLNSSWSADIRRVDSTASVSDGQNVTVNDTQATYFGGVELFANAPVRVNIEAGALGSSPYATVFFKIVPIGR